MAIKITEAVCKCGNKLRIVTRMTKYHTVSCFDCGVAVVSRSKRALAAELASFLSGGETSGALRVF